MRTLAAIVAYMLMVAFLLVGCAPRARVDVDAWRTVPGNCAPEYDAQGRMVASYCDCWAQ